MTKPEWAYIVKSEKGSLCSVLCNRTALNFLKSGDLSDYVSLHVSLLNVREDGLSHANEFPDLLEIDNAVLEVVDLHEGILVGRTTSQGTRVYQTYFRDGFSGRDYMNTIHSRFPAYHMQVEMSPDPDWQSYRQLYNNFTRQ